MPSTSSKSYEKKLKRIFQVCVDLFQKYDTDGSGDLDRDEIKVLYDDLSERQGIPKMTDDELDTHLAKWDEDGNGEVDLDEFLAMCLPIIENHMKNEANANETQKKLKRDQVSKSVLLKNLAAEDPRDEKRYYRQRASNDHRSKGESF